MTMHRVKPENHTPSERGVLRDGRQNQAIKEVIALQLAEAMRERSLSKARMAVMLNTSRSQVDRLLDPASDVTLSTLERAAVLVGRRVQIHLVE